MQARARTGGAMRTDPLSQPGRRLAAMVLGHACAVALLVGFFGCLAIDGGDLQGDPWFLCLQQHNNDPGCCPKGWHISYSTCCPPGSHQAMDVTHPDWVICADDDDTDAGADAHTYTDAGLADAP
jgi:hypothetical protein